MLIVGRNGRNGDRCQITFPGGFRHESHLSIAHNHPGGSLVPSTYDELITRKIYEGGQLLDIKLYDHIIVGENAYYSFADEGKLNFSRKKQ